MNYVDTSSVPFVFLSFLSFLGWVLPLITLLLLFTKAKHPKHHFARYIFKIAATFTVAFLTIFYLAWTTTLLTFLFPFASGWRLGSAAVIFAHITLFLIILLTLLAAVFDTPKDWKQEGPMGPPMGPGTRAPSQA
ncbi:uncharacterized protein B0J16DRAFT_373307 [Fusarium flagelliforme]|uniref:Uncharacterized protein n=1 Tax=Fusarium flagelliforme TaxID=2675880 RepID=A0A395M7S6_9HYPO|nr:uncharacterized protein B0J16DRAFT_373307 [Fusarium flagelliforme]KAH7182722.1 hypothetical protein B0J16DRAFT_373307 [Fusarium flagelliforme]RFN43935.1 hypothetical protein FIE12Z_11842 [Fusarium flagelliforme]